MWSDATNRQTSDHVLGFSDIGRSNDFQHDDRVGPHNISTVPLLLHSPTVAINLFWVSESDVDLDVALSLLTESSSLITSTGVR